MAIQNDANNVQTQKQTISLQLILFILHKYTFIEENTNWNENKKMYSYVVCKIQWLLEKFIFYKYLYIQNIATKKRFRISTPTLPTRVVR